MISRWFGRTTSGARRTQIPTAGRFRRHAAVRRRVSSYAAIHCFGTQGLRGGRGSDRLEAQHSGFCDQAAFTRTFRGVERM